jgi:hypothetical protein
MLRLTLLLAVFLFASVVGLPAAAAPVTVRDLDGRAWQPLAPAPGEVHVVVFVMTDCPVSNVFAPEIGRIAADYRGKGVRTFLAYVDPGATAARLRTHLADYYKGALPAIPDGALTLADAAGATIAPHAVVYTSKGLVYSGRVNDLYIDIGRRRRAPTRHDLRDAIDAARSGRPAVPASTQPIGCFIERPRR